MQQKLLIGTAGALAASLIFAGCASQEPTDPGGGDDAVGLDALIEQAKADGGLTLTWGESIQGGTEASGPLADGFREFYDLPDFDIQYTTGPSMPQLGATIAQEVQAGQAPTSDIYIGYATHFAGLAEEGFDTFESFDWSWADQMPDGAVSEAGDAVVVGTSIPVISYNPAAVANPPSSLQDLTKPEYEGVIASTPYAANFDYLASDLVWGEEKTEEFLEAFTRNVSGLIRCHNPEALTTGQFDIFAFDCDQGSTLKHKDAGDSVDYVIPSDAEMVVYIYAGIPKTSPHKAAAQLWLNYMQTRHAQDILWETARNDSSLVEGSNTTALIDEAESDGTKFIHFPMDVVLREGVMPGNEFEQRMQEILNTVQD